MGSLNELHDNEKILTLTVIRGARHISARAVLTLTREENAMREEAGPLFASSLPNLAPKSTAFGPLNVAADSGKKK